MLVLAALVIGVLVAWWIFHASRRTSVELEDSEAEAGAAKRNQALIDSPPAAMKGDLDKVAADNLTRDFEENQAAKSAASPGAVSAAANTDSIAAASADADAEAGAAVPAREAIRKMEDVSPQASPETLSAAPAASQSDDLRRIKGVGPKLVTLLSDQGVTSFAQIAAWDDADIDRIDTQLGRFQGRIRRDDWVSQARLLAADDIAGYEERFGKV